MTASRDLALIAEQIGRTVAPGPLHPVSTVLAGLVDAEDAEGHSATIESLVSGELDRVVGGLRAGSAVGAVAQRR